MNSSCTPETIVDLVIGSVGTVFVTIALLPQIYRAFTTKSTADLSMAWLLIECIGSAFMLSYGALRADRIIVTINTVISLSHSLLIFAKWRYERTPTPHA